LKISFIVLVKMKDSAQTGYKILQCFFISVETQSTAKLCTVLPNRHNELLLMRGVKVATQPSRLNPTVITGSLRCNSTHCIGPTLSPPPAHLSLSYNSILAFARTPASAQKSAPLTYVSTRRL
jgi:hypothetical protein